MKRILFFGIILILSSCKEKVSTEDLTLLNGYWEIEQVNLPNGETKAYSVNTTVDYIQIKDLSGFRKKVYPQLDGTYDTSNDSEHFELTEKPEGYEFHYKTELSEWTEKLNSLQADSFSVTNTDNITYTYKRFQPINVQK